MIDLRKGKEITAVLKIYTQFSPKKEFFISVCGHQDLSNDKLSDPINFQWPETTSGTQCARYVLLLIELTRIKAWHSC